MNIERMILSNVLFYNDAKHFLPRINKNWFTDKVSVKLIEVMTDMYYNNIEIDYVSLSKHFERKEVIEIIQLQQEASGIMDLKPHLLQLEYEYIKRQVVAGVLALNIEKDLEGLIGDIQKVLDETTFSTHKEPSSIVKVTNKVVDQIVYNAEKGGTLTGKPTGWQFLDKYIGGYNEGDLIVMAGRPGMGKTAIALTLTKEFAQRGGKALFISLEMSNEQLAKRYISLIGDIENWKIRNGVLKSHEIEQVCNIANNQRIEFFIDDDVDSRIAQIKAKAKLHKSRKGLDLLVIDYIQLIKGTKTNREQEVAEISRTLKLLAKELKITVMILAQLSRKSEERADKRPMLSDLRESGAIEQDADIVMFPFRPMYYEQDKPEVEEAELIIAKNRNGECVTIPTYFEGRYTIYRENLTPRQF
jgi:replicative DNA helicase